MADWNRNSAEYARLLLKHGTGRGGHALFSPSSSAGWLNCAGFLLANALAEDDAGVEAAYGTAAHEIAQHWLSYGRPDHLVGTDVVVVNGKNKFTINLDEDMFAHVERYIDWCQEVAHDGDVFVEQKVDISNYTPIPNQRGTADFFVCKPHLLIITDLKMGTGVKVFVENNPQAMLYALGVFEEWDWIYGFQKIVIRIAQPRLDYWGVWECSREELIEFGEFVKLRAGLSWDENAARTPGDKQCRYCAVRLTCAAKSMHLDSLIDDSYDASMDGADYAYTDAEVVAYERAVRDDGGNFPVDPRSLSTDFLEYRLKFRKLYENWFNQIYEELHDRAERGEALRYFKLGRGRNKTEWNRDKAEEFTVKLHDDLRLSIEEINVQPELVSPATMRRVLQRHVKMKPAEITAFLKPYIKITPSRTSLVAADDERDDVNDLIDGADGDDIANSVGDDDSL